MNESILEQAGTTSTLDITIRDLAIFANWMQQTVMSLDRGESIPDTPDPVSGQVRGWVQAIQKLEERSRLIDEKQMALETNLNAHETQLNQLLSQLYLNTASLYDSLGQVDKAQEVREKVGTFQSR
ncbi:hypothetical protein MYX04_06235 [Nitrospiraceae bacterium AH_259_D15_M11_P09]|nr:hypothetical protein [Nitrospiraceae bacterium AH_259_D15_M11_P09]